jgi:hypothetical protein
MPAAGGMPSLLRFPQFRQSLRPAEAGRFHKETIRLSLKRDPV